MNTLSPELLSSFLNIPNIKITNTQRNNDGVFIYIDSLEAGTNCYQCGKFTQDFHGYGSELKLRHLPVFNLKTYLIIKPKHYLCCHHSTRLTTTQKCPWYREKSKATQGYQNHILLSLINSTVQDDES